MTTDLERIAGYAAYLRKLADADQPTAKNTHAAAFAFGEAIKLGAFRGSRYCDLHFVLSCLIDGHKGNLGRECYFDVLVKWFAQHEPEIVFHTGPVKLPPRQLAHNPEWIAHNLAALATILEREVLALGGTVERVADRPTVDALEGATHTTRNDATSTVAELTPPIPVRLPSTLSE